MSSTEANTASKSRHIEFLDVMRGFAILAVFVFHSARSANAYTPIVAWSDLHFLDFSGAWASKSWGNLLCLPMTLGNCGVAIFFVISGFCIHVSHSRRPDPMFRKFFIRRVLRIFPPYLLALLLFAFVYPFGELKLSVAEDFRNFFAHLFLVHNLYELKVYAGINPSFWSIAAEAQLYALFPLMFLFANQYGWRKTLLVCLAIEIPLRMAWAGGLVLGHPAPRWLVCSALSYMFSWCIGAVIADAWSRGDRTFLAGQSFWLWFAISVATYFYRPLTYFSFPVTAFATGALIAGMLDGTIRIPNFPGRKWIANHLTFVGTVSYSFYLLHQPLVEMVRPVASRILNVDLQSQYLLTVMLNLASWPLLLGIAWLMYRFVEIPCISLARHLTKTNRIAEPATKKMSHKRPEFARRASSKKADSLVLPATPNGE